MYTALYKEITHAATLEFQILQRGGEHMETKKRLGELLVQTGLISQEILDKALKLQVGGNRRLGYLLIKMQYITEEQLQSVLSEQLDLPIIDIHQQFNPEVRRILPRYLCKKYNVLPLSLDDHNLLNIAMVDPSDCEAVEEIEQYTDKLLRPFLASHSAIEKAIPVYIPWSPKDALNTLTTRKFIALIAIISLFLILITITKYNKDRLRAQYGIKQVTENGVLYQNHELKLVFDRSGKASLQGRGAYAGGTYSITFNDLDSLKNFIQRKQNDFSTAQKKWLEWAMEKQASR